MSYARLYLCPDGGVYAVGAMRGYRKGKNGPKSSRTEGVAAGLLTPSLRLFTRPRRPSATPWDWAYTPPSQSS